MRGSFAIRFVVGWMLAATPLISAGVQPSPQSSLKLYVFDCGTIAPMKPQLYNLKAEEISGSEDFSHHAIWWSIRAAR
jgi:hypothetical protein